MQTTTIRDLLSNTTPPGVGDVIYVVRDQDLIFYIGQSKRDIRTRFREHIQQPSRLGRLIRANHPESSAWRVDFYALADCRPFVTQKRLFADQAWEHFDMDMAEQAMIRQMRPVLNQDFNLQPTPLPATYRGHDVLNQGKPMTRTSLAIGAGAGDMRLRPWLNRMSLAGWVQEREANGRIIWRHTSGVTRSDTEIAPYRQAGKVPPLA